MDSIEVFGYCRVSTDEQEKTGFSIGSQVTDVKQAARMRGYDIPEENIYIDDGYSASNLKRPAMQSLLKVLANNFEHKILIVRHPDRIVRNLMLKRSLQKVFTKYNVELITLQGQWDGIDSDSSIVADITMLFAENEINKIPQRVIDGFRGSANLGNYPLGGLPPRGFRKEFNEKAGKGYYLVPDENNAKEVIKIFNTIATNRVTVRDMALFLQKTKVMNVRWTEKQLVKMLDNPIYYGRLVTRWYDKENHTIPIVSEELWMKVQKIIHRRKKNTTHEYLFNRILKCSKCGSNLICQPAWKKLRNSNERVLYKYYYCKVCKKRINETKLVKEFIHTYPFHKLLKVDKDVIQQLKNVNNRIRNRINHINDDYDRGLINDEMYRNEIEKALTKIKQNNEEIVEIEKNKVEKFNRKTYSEKRAIILKNIDYVSVDLDNNTCEFAFKENNLNI